MPTAPLRFKLAFSFEVGFNEASVEMLLVTEEVVAQAEVAVISVDTASSHVEQSSV